MIRVRALLYFAIVSAALGNVSFAAEPELAFDTYGGEAWTFSLQLSGQAPNRDCDTVIVHSPPGDVTATRLEHRFEAHAPLQSGENLIGATCQRAGRTTARAQPQLWRVAIPDTPKAWIRVWSQPRSVHLDGGHSEPALSKPAPIVSYEWRARAGNPDSLHLADGRTLDLYEPTRAERIELAAPAREGEYYVLLQVTDALGRIDRSTGVFRVSNGDAQLVDLRTENPQWVDAAILYGAAPYFFTPQNFRGVADRLDEIATLGATAVWLSPVNEAAPNDFGYAVVDHFKLREQFGTESEFRALVNTAHRLGLRVLVDFVPNHLSEYSPRLQDALHNGPRSPYYMWFDRKANGEITQYFDWAHLKNLEYDNPQVRAYITAAFAHFVRDLDVDGFRVDASWAVAQRAPEFWPQLRDELKRIDPDIFLLAEASARERYHFFSGFDAAYDWTLNLGEWAWKDAFREEGVDVGKLRSALTNEGRGYPADALILRFLNNNDTGERFISRFGEPLAKLAATLEFTVPGIPLVYNGDEVGAQFQPYAEGPPIEWNDRSDLAAHYRRLIEARRAAPALRSREMQLLRTNQDRSVLAFLRPAGSPAEEVLVLLNFSDREVRVRAGDETTRQIFLRFARSRDVLHGEHVMARRAAFDLQSLASLVMRKE